MIKICTICGKEFETKYKQQKVCNDVHTRKCIICGAEFILPRTQSGYKKVTCSQKCKAIHVANICKENDLYKESREKAKQTCLDRYGVENPIQNLEFLEKSKSTLKSHYGTENPMQSDEIKNRVKKTNLERYGYDNPSKSPEVIQHIKDTFKEKYDSDNAMHVTEFVEKQKESLLNNYGVEVPLKNPDVVAKMKTTNLEKYGYENVFAVPEIREKIIEERYKNTGYYNPFSNPEVKKQIAKTNQEKYGVPWACMREEARCHNAISRWNLKFAKMLEDNNNINYELEYRIGNYSYDIRVNDTLIEIDSTAFHNSYMDIYDKDSNGKDKDYHLNKSNVANENGFRCIHVFDWDDWSKILALLLPKEKIYARKCKIEEVSKSDCNEFLNQYHLQGTCNGQTYRYGLFYDDNLVEIMTFGKPRYNKNYQYELLRLCTDSKYQVVGGASKLFKHFVNEINPSSIISYCDYSKFNGEVYKEIGMKFSHLNVPSKIWSKANLKITHNLLCQRGYDQLFNTDYGKGTSNEELMLNSGWLPVYDCGQIVFKYKGR